MDKDTMPPSQDALLGHEALAQLGAAPPALQLQAAFPATLLPCPAAALMTSPQPL